MHNSSMEFRIAHMSGKAGISLLPGIVFCLYNLHVQYEIYQLLQLWAGVHTRKLNSYV